MGKTKQQLIVDNNASFPNNNANYITPALLRDFNRDMIDNTVNQDVYTADSASFNQRIGDLASWSSSLDTNFASQTEFNSYTSSNNAKVNALIAATASFATSAITASSLTTASFAGGTMTFTKGDGSTFGVVIPDVSGSTLPAGTISGSAQISSLGFVSSSVTASSLTTASFSGNTLTFTKGNGTTFGVTIPDVSGSTINTGSFATTGSNTFYGDEIISGNLDVRDNIYAAYIDMKNASNGNGGSIFFRASGSNVITGSSEFWSLNPIFQDGDLAIVVQPSNEKAISFGLKDGYTKFWKGLRLESGFDGWDIGNTPLIISSSFGGQTEILDVKGNVSASNLNLSGALTASILEGYALVGGVGNVSKLVATSSFGGGTTINTGSFATTGSNLFTGDQTLSDASLNTATLATISGSLVLVGKTFTSSSAALAHISASAANQVNLVFKNNNNTGTTIVSGSNNIFTNPAAPTATFNRYIGGSQNYYSNVLPQLTGSAAFSPTMNNNIFNTGMLMRVPVSSSAYTFTGNILSNPTANGIQLGTAAATGFTRAVSGLSMTNNVINGSLNATAYKTSLSASVNIGNNNIGGTTTLNMDSSSINLNTSIVQGTFSVNNSYFPSTYNSTTAALGANSGIFVGTNTLYASGSNTSTTTPRLVSNSAMVGGANVISASLNGDLAQVNSTILLGQSLTVIGSNSIPAGLTGADWGSVFAGRWNSIDGTKDMTAETVFAVGTGTSTSNRKTGFLIDSGSNTFVEGTLNVSGSTSLTGSLTIQSGSAFFANGNRQFNVGAFQSNVSQSGSANVSQSMNFETTDISSGVSIVSNSQITLANSGTYNIQFSAQIDRVSGSGTDTVHIWLKKNGSNVSASAGAVTISGLAAAAKTIAAWNYVVDAAASDYYELCWESTDSNIQLINQAAGGNIPSTPSIILTVTQVR